MTRMAATEDDSPVPSRTGSGVDLARRMDKMESRQDTIETEVRTLAATVARVEQNQNHAVEVSKLRFDAIDTGVKGLDEQAKAFAKRFEGIMSGEVETAQSRMGRDLLADWGAWRKAVDTDRESFGTFETQGKLIARLGVLLITSNIVAIIVAVVAAVTAAGSTQ